MREILFEGKLRDKEWIFWNAFGQIVCDDGKTFNFVTYFGVNYWNIVDLIPLLIPETVGQFTGLTDKNRKKIFEGDIVKCWSEGVEAQGEIRQRVDGLWILYPAFQNNVFWGLCPLGNGTTTVEVIGNIHDNPDLLKGEDAE